MTKLSQEHRCPFLNALLESADVIIGAFDAESLSLLTFNSALTRLVASKYGRTLRVGAALEDIFDSGEVAAWRSLFLRALTDGPFGMEHRGLVDGRVFWLTFNRVMEEGRCLGVSLFCRDITEIRSMVRMAESADDRFAKLFRANPGPLQVNDAETGVMVDVNDAFAHWLGYQRSELIGHSTLDLGIWVDPSARQSLIDVLLVAGRVAGVEATYCHRDGHHVHGLISCETIILEGKRCFLVSTTDITTLRSAEQALRESEQRNRRLIETAPEAIVVIDTDTGQFVDANENAARLAGFDKATLLSFSPAQLGQRTRADGPSVADARQHRQRAIAGEAQTYEWSYVRPDGGRIDCEVRLSSLFDGRRKLLRASVIDITERKRLEREATVLRAQLAHAQRMEALGRLASGVAHDFNNILGAIMGHLDLALMRTSDDESRSLLEGSRQAANRAMDLIRQIRGFGRQKQDKRPVQVAPLVKEAVKLLRVGLPFHIVLEERYPSSGWVLADPTQIHQVVVNLFTNARLAMADQAGTIDVVVEERDLDARLIPQYPWAKSGPHVCLTVKDTGCGMTSETLESVFDPFFTTRPDSEGTGLGLSVVYGIVKDAAGAIDVKSEPGRGSTFDVYLPLSAPSSV
jgi:PAS domain S-box-containing protein